jgi:hypothetical protein
MGDGGWMRADVGVGCVRLSVGYQGVSSQRAVGSHGAVCLSVWCAVSWPAAGRASGPLQLGEERAWRLLSKGEC